MEAMSPTRSPRISAERMEGVIASPSASVSSGGSMSPSPASLRRLRIASRCSRSSPRSTSPSPSASPSEKRRLAELGTGGPVLATLTGGHVSVSPKARRVESRARVSQRLSQLAAVSAVSPNLTAQHEGPSQPPTEELLLCHNSTLSAQSQAARELTPTLQPFVPSQPVPTTQPSTGSHSARAARAADASPIPESTGHEIERLPSSSTIETEQEPSHNTRAPEELVNQSSLRNGQLSPILSSEVSSTDNLSAPAISPMPWVRDLGQDDDKASNHSASSTGSLERGMKRGLSAIFSSPSDGASPTSSKLERLRRSTGGSAPTGASGWESRMPTRGSHRKSPLASGAPGSSSSSPCAPSTPGMSSAVLNYPDLLQVLSKRGHSTASVKSPLDGKPI